ncbi:MAG: TetR/AcrR family transcriptional regulator [Anaerolineales bacterium]|jgi:AcrR family transcriptional regulator
MPKAFTQREKELIATRLLEEGFRLFSAYGLRKTNIEELAAAAGISKGAFYSFYPSKEALFMDVIEEAERRVRREILTVIDLPGPSPRARLVAILKKAFDLFEAIPILQFVTGGDYDLLFRRVPPEKLQEHLASDRVFFDELIARCRDAGIPIRAQPEQISRLLYLVVLAILHQDDFVLEDFNGSVDLFLELVAAYCLGEIEIGVLT